MPHNTAEAFLHFPLLHLVNDTICGSKTIPFHSLWALKWGCFLPLPVNDRDAEPTAHMPKMTSSKSCLTHRIH